MIRKNPYKNNVYTLISSKYLDINAIDFFKRHPFLKMKYGVRYLYRSKPISGDKFRIKEIVKDQGRIKYILEDIFTNQIIILDNDYNWLDLYSHPDRESDD